MAQEIPADLPLMYNFLASDYKELHQAVEWYFECCEVSMWHTERDDVDCIDMHRDEEYCPWCTPYDEIEDSLQQAEEQLKKLTSDI